MPLRTHAHTAGLSPAEPKKKKKKRRLNRKRIFLSLYWRARCLSPPRSSFSPSIPFSVRWDLCIITSPYKKKTKNCHGSSTSHTETSAHATLFPNKPPSPLLARTKLPLHSQPNEHISSVLSESVVGAGGAGRGGAVGYFLGIWWAQ